ncbi:MAG: hypothetical protein ACI9EB_001366 [Pseudomonas sp.]|jgi:hypothetical protein
MAVGTAKLAPPRIHRSYLNEQLRLAALFAGLSSELDLFSDLEHNGDELADRQFLLSFDDGPSASKGNSDRLLATPGKHPEPDAAVAPCR